jgi:hypothetical protein
LIRLPRARARRCACSAARARAAPRHRLLLQRAAADRVLQRSASPLDARARSRPARARSFSAWLRPSNGVRREVGEVREDRAACRCPRDERAGPSLPPPASTTAARRRAIVEGADCAAVSANCQPDPKAAPTRSRLPAAIGPAERVRQRIGAAVDALPRLSRTRRLAPGGVSPARSCEGIFIYQVPTLKPPPELPPRRRRRLRSPAPV